MASLSKVLAIVLLLGLVILGLVQTMIDLPSSSLAGAATGEVVKNVDTQREINLCMNECMRSCVVSLEDDVPCRAECEPSCGVVNA